MTIKAIQMMAGAVSSAEFLSNRLKPNRNCGGISFFSISRVASPSTRPTFPRFSFFPCSPVGKTHRFRPFRMSSSGSDPPQDGTSSSDSLAAYRNFVVQGNARKINFCQWCGGRTKHEIPDGEEKTRAICTGCGKIAYENPKMVVGCLIEHENKILLCKRKIQPSYGLWTLPAGYMEIGESAAEGAIRETQEEAGAEVQVLSPFAQLDIPLIGQVRHMADSLNNHSVGLLSLFLFLLLHYAEQTYIIFLAKLRKPHFSPGPESIECRLFDLDELPFDSLAFSSMFVTLKLYLEDVKAGGPKFHYGTINKRPGTSPSDIQAFSLDYHLCP